jgi:hypothetical protein
LYFSLGYAPISINTDGVGSVTIDAHAAAVPLVVKYFPEFPVCDGSASTAPQDEVVPSVVKYLPELPVWLGTTYVVESVATKVLDVGITVELILVAVATPISGVVSVGLVLHYKG